MKKKETASATLNLRVRPSFKKKLAQAAAADDMSIVQYLIAAVELKMAVGEVDAEIPDDTIVAVAEEIAKRLKE